MKKKSKKVILPLKLDDLLILKERAKHINQVNDEITNLKISLFNYLKYTCDDKGDNQRHLFEIPFEAVTFHDLDDKEAYEKNGTFVNFSVLGIHTIRVKYLEGVNSDLSGAFAKLRIEFLWNNLLPHRTPVSGVFGPYGSSFNDENLCFAETFVFQTKKQYEAFKEIYCELNRLAQELGMYS